MMEKLLIGAITVLLISLPGGTSTAIAAESATSAPTGDDASPLEEITVSARKREESLENVPAAITVVSAETMLQNHEVEFQDYYATVPGLSISDQGTTGAVSISLRGITTGAFGTATVGVTVDDVPIGATNTALIDGTGYIPQFDPADLQRIEILKGPQGTLYGASSMGGVLRYVTAVPDLTSTIGRVEVDGSAIPGGGSGYGVRGSFNVPLIPDTLAVRASVFDRHDPGFVNDPSDGREDVNGVDVYGGRVDTLWSVTNDFSVRLAAMIQRTEGDGDSTIDTNSELRPVSGDLNQSRLPGTGGYLNEYQLYTATLKFHSSLFDVTNISAYSGTLNNSDVDVTNALGPPADFFLGVPGATSIISLKSSKFSEELRLSSAAGSHLEWQLGGFYTSEDNAPNYGLFYANNPQTGVDAGQLLNDQFAAQYHEYAGFGDLTYHFTDEFDVQIGGRESHNWQHYNDNVTGLLQGPPSIVSAVSQDNSFTYLVTPELRISDSLMTYVRVASGYQPGGPNTPPPSTQTTGVPTVFGPSTTVNYELGVKSLFFERRLSIDADIFYIDWSKIQLGGTTSDGFGYTFNGGKAKSQGVEIATDFKPVAGLTISAAAAYIDATLTNNAGEGFPGVAGNVLPFSSKYSASLSADQRFPIARSVNGFIGATAAYVGKRYEGFPPILGQPQPVIPEYSYGNVRAGILTQGFTVTAFVKNVTNKLGILQTVPSFPNADGSVRTAILTPRTMGISISKDF
jgi:iron complex outermembrane recepter protein